MQTVIIHTDGGCSGNPGPGGWAAIIRGTDHARELSGGEPATTNNRMELRAAIESLRTLTEPHTVEIFTDSVYLKDGITKWLARWKRTGSAHDHPSARQKRRPLERIGRRHWPTSDRVAVGERSRRPSRQRALRPTRP